MPDVNVKVNVRSRWIRRRNKGLIFGKILLDPHQPPRFSSGYWTDSPPVIQDSHGDTENCKVVHCRWFIERERDDLFVKYGCWPFLMFWEFDLPQVIKGNKRLKVKLAGGEQIINDMISGNPSKPKSMSKKTPPLQPFQRSTKTGRGNSHHSTPNTSWAQSFQPVITPVSQVIASIL